MGSSRCRGRGSSPRRHSGPAGRAETRGRSPPTPAPRRPVTHGAAPVSSCMDCPEENANVAQSSDVVARTGWRDQRLGTRYSRPRSEASAITMRTGNPLLRVHAMSGRAGEIAGIQQLEARLPDPVEGKRRLGIVGAHVEERVPLHPRFAHHVHGIDAFEQASGREHSGDRSRRRTADGVDAHLRIVALAERADRAQQRRQRAALVGPERDRAGDRRARCAASRGDCDD